MEIIKVLESRYSTKEFDSTKKLSEEQICQIEDILRLSPSSTNSQPWHFTIAISDEAKKRVAKGTQNNFIFNEQKVLDASAVIIFSSLVDLTEEYINKLVDKEEEDGRFPQSEQRTQNYGARKTFANMHKYDYKDYQHWTEKQVYLNLGNFLLGVATLGIDALAMEGVDFKVIDEEFKLREKGYTSSLVVAVGFHKESDYNKDLPKSRLEKKDIIEKL